MRKLLFAAILVVAASGFAVSPALAADEFARSRWQPCEGESARANPWAVDWSRLSGGEAVLPIALTPTPVSFDVVVSADQAEQGRRRPVAFEYSEGYKVRARIHKIAAFATLPLFVAEYLVGQNLYTRHDTASDSTRGAHRALAVSTGVVFGVNSITGVWNLIEGRKDPHRSTTRTIHGILMLVADAGFAVTAATAPESEHEHIGSQNEGMSRSTHRAIAITSMGIAVVSYLVMVIGGR